MDEWRNTNRVIVVDAVSSGNPPGTVYRFDVNAKPIPRKFFHYSSHSFGLAEAVEVERALNMLPHQIIIYGVEGKIFQQGTMISPETDIAAQKLITVILQELRLATQELDSPSCAV